MPIENAFENFKNIPFPGNSASSEELSEIFYDLVSYDSYVASQVDKYLTGKRDVDLQYESELENKLNAFLQTINKNDIDYESANSMLSYMKEIKKLLMTVKEEK